MIGKNIAIEDLKKKFFFLISGISSQISLHDLFIIPEME